MNTPDARVRLARVPRNPVLRWCSSVRVGLVVILMIGVYAAFGTVPLGPLFEVLGGNDWAPGRTLRHLPAIDLRESEYYSTSLFGGLLLALIVNMSLATALRIPWRSDRAGVILTHAGVVVLAIGAFIATRSPVNATIALFADEQTNQVIDRTRSVLSVSGPDSGTWRLDDRLPRYADFGVPWSSRQRAIELGEGVRITGFAHSARVVQRIEEGLQGDPPGWELEERLVTGEQRVFAMLASEGTLSRQTLSDSTVVLTFSERWPFADLNTSLSEALRDHGAGCLWIEPEPGVTLALPAQRDAVVTGRSEQGLWRAEFLEHAEFASGVVLGSYRLEGPEFPERLLYASSWDPRVQGAFGESPDGRGSQGGGLPEGFRSLFMDDRQPAITVAPAGWLSYRAGEVRAGDRFEVGLTIPTGPGSTLRVERFERHGHIVAGVERLPLVEDAQLLADPRLGSVIRIERTGNEGAESVWLAFDDTETRPSSETIARFGPERFAIEGTSLTLGSFEAELFRRGSLPKDFRVGIELGSDDRTERRTLSLNDPVRTTLRIRGHDRRVQLSLIGWDAEGWEASRGSEREPFEGVRYVVLSMNQREGVGIALVGGGLVLLGAGYSLARRLALAHGRTRRSKWGVTS
jgi:hypothetical protein